MPWYLSTGKVLSKAKEESFPLGEKLGIMDNPTLTTGQKDPIGGIPGDTRSRSSGCWGTTM